VTETEWSHQTSLVPEAVSVFLAEAFVCHHLGQRRLLHLLDEVREVASELADAARRREVGLTMILSRSGPTVSLHVLEEGPTVSGPSWPEAVRGAVELTGLPRPPWGVHQEADGSRRAWVSFEARPEVHSVRMLWRSSDATRAPATGRTSLR
jgi:hypothetical protein